MALVPGRRLDRTLTVTADLTNSSDWRPHGLIAASITPFRADESLDLVRLERHLDDLIAGAWMPWPWLPAPVSS